MKSKENESMIGVSGTQAARSFVPNWHVLKDLGTWSSDINVHVRYTRCTG